MISAPEKYERPSIKKLENTTPNKFGLLTSLSPVTHLDEVAVKDLVKEHGSPLFVVSEKKIRENIQEGKRAFSSRYPRVQFAWSYKTNYLDAVCQIFQQEGAWAEVVSGFEYEKAIRNGVPGSQIIFNGPHKSELELERAILQNSFIHIDHFEELYTLISLARKLKQRPKVAIRVNLDSGVYPMWDRFGFNYETGQAWDALTRIMECDELDLVGLHCHLGTFILAPYAYSTAVYKLADLMIHLKKKYNHDVDYLDLGGGFASKNTLKGAFLPGSDTNPRIDHYAQAITYALLNAGLDSQNLPTLILESGRALVDDAAWLISTVIANKWLSSGKRATIIDAGVNILVTTAWYDHKIIPAQPFSHYTEDTSIYGPLCMNIDVIREQISLPLLSKGEQVVIHDVGAYNMTQWMQFISYRPRIILIDPSRQCHVIREAETSEIFSRQEHLPEHLKSL